MYFNKSSIYKIIMDEQKNNTTTNVHQTMQIDASIIVGSLNDFLCLL